jgi:hypothetical protein
MAASAIDSLNNDLNKTKTAEFSLRFTLRFHENLDSLSVNRGKPKIKVKTLVQHCSLSVWVEALKSKRQDSVDL